jgi:acetyl-CoA acetyltransferase
MRRAAIVGVGYTKLSRNSGRGVLNLASEAALKACADAGLPVREVDGVASYMVPGDSENCEALATALALPRLRYQVDLNHAGQSPSFLIGCAAMAVSCGYADNVLVFRALNGRSGARVGTAQFLGGAAQYRYPIGYDAYLMYIAMWARRFLHETGQSSDDLAAVAIAQREYAQKNDRAILREPLDLDSYYSSRYVAEPFRVADCTREVDGACAVLVTSLDRARDLAQPPAVIAASSYHAGPRPGLDVGNHVLFDDYTRNFTSHLRDELFARAGLTVNDLQFAEIYDCFTSTVLMGLEGLGICERGGSGAFVRSGATRIDGRFPVNTNGGLLAEGYLHGMNCVAEATLQIQGRCGDRQAPRHEVGVVTSGALVDGSALILTSDN